MSGLEYLTINFFDNHTSDPKCVLYDMIRFLKLEKIGKKTRKKLKKLLKKWNKND